MIQSVFYILLIGGFLQHFKCEGKVIKIGVLILSQPNQYHERLAKVLLDNIDSQVVKLDVNIILSAFQSHDNKVFNVLGHWTVFPLFQKLSELNNIDWILVLEDQTEVNVKKIIKILSSYDSSQDVFAGYALKDSHPTIIHHFANTSEDSILLYPHFSAGFFISFSLLKKLTTKCQDCQFSIDPKYELAKFIWNTASVKLTPESRLCLTKDKDSCATWIKDRPLGCGSAVSSEKIFVAVKTCKKFHKDRVTVLNNTWAPDVKNLHMFSDAADDSIPTIKLNVENVASGHCEKTLSIMKFYVHNKVSLDFLVIVDDDTLLSFQRLKKLLSCYNPAHDLALGERYGYSVSNNLGYNYPTGGSGMIFSLPTLKKLVRNCRCPSIDSPDDMIIGLCLKNLNVPVTHSPFFHQARPIDYSPEFLSPLKHISFHKHWMIDPYTVYKDWLHEQPDFTQQHSEL